jgi:hypothetical protein
METIIALAALAIAVMASPALAIAVAENFILRREAARSR